MVAVWIGVIKFGCFDASGCVGLHAGWVCGFGFEFFLGCFDLRTLLIWA